MEWHVISRQKDASSGKVEAKKSDGTGVKIRVKRLSKDATEVGIRIGNWGDRRASELFFEKLDSLLKK